MDVKVYKKEAVKQPSGTSYVISPNIIDLYPIITKDENDNEIISGAEELTDEDALIEQACALATIWQKGLDPLDLEEGIRWSEAILEEINVVQLMEDITNAVADIIYEFIAFCNRLENKIDDISISPCNSARGNKRIKAITDCS